MTLIAALAFAGLSPLRAAENTEPRATDFVLYFGLEVSTEVRGTDCPVVSGNDSAVQVRHGGAMVRVPIKDVALKTEMEPKLSRARATITGITADRVYSPIKDPGRDALGQQLTLEDVQTHNAMASQIRANTDATFATGMQSQGANPLAAVNPSEVSGSLLTAVQSGIAADHANAMHAYRSSLPGAATGDDAMFDAFEVSFEVSATTEHDNASGVLRLLVRDPKAPQKARQALKFFNVRDLGPSPRRVTVQQMYLPPGFTLDSYAVHLYADGREIPTNLSANRLEISTDEANQFLVLRHLHAHRNANVPAQIIPDFLPGELHQLISVGQRTTKITLAIDRTGRISQTTPPVSGSLSPELEAMLRQVRFFPALHKGAPVDSEGTFTLGQFAP